VRQIKPQRLKPRPFKRNFWNFYGMTERRALPGFVVSERFSEACEVMP
jgi:hypothetical protein